MTAKEQYRALCEEKRHAIPLFQQHWWMEAVCQNKNWDVALAYDDGRIIAALPYLIRKRWGMKFIIQPQMTPFNGPCYFYPDNISESHRLDFEKQATAQIVAQLDKLHLSHFLQNFSPSVTNWLPYYWHGFKQTTRYTYRINCLDNLDALFDTFDREKRQRKIRRLATQVQIDTTSITPTQFAEYHKDYWLSRGHKDLMSREFISNLVASAIERKQGMIYALRDNSGKLIMGRFVAYDEHCAYALMSFHMPDNRISGANEIMTWLVLNHIANYVKTYDFEGSMEESLEYVYRSFGAEQTPYHQVWKNNSLIFALLLKIKQHRKH